MAEDLQIRAWDLQLWVEDLRIWAWDLQLWAEDLQHAAGLLLLAEACFDDGAGCELASLTTCNVAEACCCCLRPAVAVVPEILAWAGDLWFCCWKCCWRSAAFCWDLLLMLTLVSFIDLLPWGWRSIHESAALWQKIGRELSHECFIPCSWIGWWCFVNKCVLWKMLIVQIWFSRLCNSCQLD